MRIVPLALASLLLSGTAYAHIAMTFPTPRSTDQKAGPCGAAGSTRGTKITEFAPGEVINVEWDETVDHPGHYRISFDADGNDFTNPNIPADDFPETLVEPIADKSGGHYSQQITLPSEPCDNCTLQLVQVMTTAVPYNSFYFQCADIRIGDGLGGGDAGTGGGGGDGSSGGCSTGGGVGGGGLLIGLLALRRRRRK